MWYHKLILIPPVPTEWHNTAAAPSSIPAGLHDIILTGNLAGMRHYLTGTIENLYSAYINQHRHYSGHAVLLNRHYRGTYCFRTCSSTGTIAGIRDAVGIKPRGRLKWKKGERKLSKTKEKITREVTPTRPNECIA